MEETILSTLLEAVSLQKEKIDDINSTLELLQDETKLNQDELVKVRENLTKQIEDIYIQTNNLIEKSIKGLNLEADKVDYQRIEVSIKAKINRLFNEKNQDVSELRSDLKSYVIENLSKYKPKNGTDGKDADNDLIIKELQNFITENRTLFKGKDGADGIGRDGADGVGIEDITRVKDELIITLTNGTTKKFKIPKDTLRVMGGGGSSVNFDNLTELTNINDTDFVIILRGNQQYKASINTLKGVFGSEMVDNTITTETGVYLTTEEGLYINFEGI